jgi:hypothetical protein
MLEGRRIARVSPAAGFVSCVSSSDCATIHWRHKPAEGAIRTAQEDSLRDTATTCNAGIFPSPADRNDAIVATTSRRENIMFRTFSLFGILASLAISGALPAHALVSLNGTGENGRELNGREINGREINGRELNGGGSNGITRNGAGENGLPVNGGGTNGDAGGTPAGSSALAIQAFELPPERK